MTCPTWGGEKSNILYLTSASGNNAWTAEAPEGDEGGNLFKVVFDDVTGIVKSEFDG